jgi:hypothetical protein
VKLETWVLRLQIPSKWIELGFAAFGDQIGDTLSPLKSRRIKRVFLQGSQTAEFVDLIFAIVASL